MKQRVFDVHVLVAGFVALIGLYWPIAASAEGRNVSEVWAREDDYWRFVEAGDVERYGRVEGLGRESKITHTWMRAGSTWRIIGGMCGGLDPIEAK